MRRALLLAGLIACGHDQREQAAPTRIPQARIDTSYRPEPEDTWFAYRHWSVSELGIGPVRVGMTFTQADSALGGRLEVPDSLSADCDYAGIEGVASAVHFLTGNGRIGRVDVLGSRVATSRGIRIGDPESRVKEAYAGVRERPHEYIDGHYLSVAPGAPGDTMHWLVFETDGRAVIRYRAGLRPWVEYIEGCS